MPLFKLNTWSTKPWMTGVFIFLFLSSACFCFASLTSDHKFLQTIVPVILPVLILCATSAILIVCISQTPVRLQKLVTEGKTAENDLLKSRESLRQLTNYIAKVHEEDRQTLSRELHDELGQQLTVLKIDLSRLGKKISPAGPSLADDIREMLDLIDTMIEIVRKISVDLRPGMLDDIGLIATLDWYCDDFTKRTGITTSFISDVNDDKLPQKLNIDIFRIFQESLAKVAKDSGAEKVDVSLKYLGQTLIVLIEDDGKEPDVSIDKDNKIPAIEVMKEKARMINGTYERSVIPGHGTIVEVTIPITNNDLN